ncbi:HDIG domain-containing protein [bacterium]|nr:HDIG domain-containing protein [bacterium]MBP9810667.1 HDIG domain-containing protein [bacterium]
MLGTKVSFLPGRSPLEADVVRQIFAIAQAEGVKAYLVGGAVRDAVLAAQSLTDIGQTPKSLKGEAGALDFDFSVLADAAIKDPAISLARIVAEKLDGHFVLLDQLNDIARVVLMPIVDSAPSIYIDFAGCVGGSLELDILRRDFTVNAMVIDPDFADQVIDLTGGLEDLQNKIIRAVSEDVLIDDPLRVLRAYRFAAYLGAEIEPITRGYLKQHAKLLGQVARERISYEFFTLMNCQKVAHLVVEMGQIGLLEEIYPELKDCRKVTANSFHHLALFDHSVETIPQLEKRFEALPDWVQQSANLPLAPGVTRLAATKIAALLHDIGKPDTWEITPEGRHTFIGHDKLGAEMIRPLAEREKWSKTMTRFVERLVLWHLRPGHLFHTGAPTPKALNRFYRTVGAEVPELMILAFADFGATCGAGLAAERDRLEQCLVELMNGYPTYIEASKKLPKLMDGADVMRILGVKPGPIIGEILNSLTEAQEIKEVVNVAQAEAFVRSYKAPENQ